MGLQINILLLLKVGRLVSKNPSYIILTRASGLAGRPDTRVDNVASIEWEPDLVILRGDDEKLLCMVAISELVYLKQVY